MPTSIVVALVLAVLSILQGIFNLTMWARADPSATVLYGALNPAAVAVLAAGIAWRKNWARFIFVLVTLVGLGPVMRLLAAALPAGDPLWRLLELTYLRSALQIVAAVLLLLPVAHKWFGRR
jgi:hypothetical protein